MKESRISKTVNNTFCGLINKIINILMPFVVRTLIIHALGMEYAGLNGLFSSVLQVLNLAELGIGTAVVYCMYKPMATHDTELLCALLKYIKHLYHVIGFIVAVIGLALIPFLQYFIKGAVPDGLNITGMYSIYLLYTVIGYFFYAYKSALLNAGQMVGTISNINSGIVFFQSLAQILVIIIFKNYYIYLAMMPLFALINNFWISYAVKKIYPKIICKGDLPGSLKKDIAVRVKGLFVSRICTTTRNAFDSIFISAFLGLTSVALYGNYYYIMGAVIALLGTITTAMIASVGNSIVTESVEKNYHDLRKFNFIFNWIVGFCTCCLLTMFQPFIRLWIGENGLFSFDIVILMCVYFYFLNIGGIRAVYHDAAGLWWEARYRAVLEAVLNLLLNFILTRALGVFGTILGTLITVVLINYIYGTQIVFKYYFKGISAKEFFVDNSKYGIVTLVACFIVYFVTSKIHYYGVGGVILPFCFSLLIFNAIYLACFIKTNIYKESIVVLKNIVLGFANKISGKKL